MSARDIPALSETMDRLLGGVSESQRAEMIRRFGKGAGAVIHPGVVKLAEAIAFARIREPESCLRLRWSIQNCAEPEKAPVEALAAMKKKERREREQWIGWISSDAARVGDFGFFAQLGEAGRLLIDENAPPGRWRERALIERAFKVLVSTQSGHDFVRLDKELWASSGALKPIIDGNPGGAPTNKEVSDYLEYSGGVVVGSAEESKAFDKRVREAVELLERDAIREAIKNLVADGPRRVRVNPSTQAPEVWPPRCRGKVPEVAELFAYMADGCGWRRRWESYKPGKASAVDSIKALMAAEIARWGGL